MGEITRLLTLTSQGDSAAENALYSLVYQELRALARYHLWRLPLVTQLDAPGLVSEAYVRLAERGDLAFDNRERFFGYASRVMRNVIIDRVREQRAERRGGGEAPVTLTTSVQDSALSSPDLLVLDEALRVLQKIDSRGHDVFEMHFFSGMPVEEIGVVKGVSSTTVKRDLRKARAFLLHQLTGGGE